MHLLSVVPGFAIAGPEDHQVKYPMVLLRWRPTALEPDREDQLSADQALRLGSALIHASIASVDALQREQVIKNGD